VASVAAPVRSKRLPPQIGLAFNERTGRVLELEDLGLRLLPRLAVSTGPFSIGDRPGDGDGDF
jgi:hypothetical protein